MTINVKKLGYQSKKDLSFIANDNAKSYIQNIHNQGREVEEWEDEDHIEDETPL